MCMSPHRITARQLRLARGAATIVLLATVAWFWLVGDGGWLRPALLVASVATLLGIWLVERQQRLGPPAPRG